MSYVLKLGQKPFTILVFYIASFCTLVALTIGFAIIRDPTITQISIDFSCFFVAEWGIQIVGVAQSCSALELVALLSAITNSTVESTSRAAFRKTQRWI